MSTSKTVKIQKNKILTYSINKTGYQTVNKSLVVAEDTSINEDLTPTTGNPILYLSEDHHDRIFDCATFVCYFTPSGTYDVDSLKYVSASQTTGSSLTDIQVVKELWLAQIETALSIETPRGTSNNFVFTYNGTSWDLTGTVTVSGISQTDLGDVYGISFTGTVTTGNVITVTETQYNKFAVYVLDSNYRTNNSWSNDISNTIMPKQYPSNPQDCLESATYYNQYVFNNANLNNYTAFNYCKNKGNFILSNGIKLNCILPNAPELLAIYNYKIILDSFDPIIQAGGTDYNLTNWNFSNSLVWCCVENSAKFAWRLLNDGSWNINYWNEFGKHHSDGIIPIFEVPVM
jgi:hypothetical protein